MRIAVFSDVHGNDLALAAVQADANASGVDQFVCCGDSLQGGVQAREVIQRLKTMNVQIVFGNADDIVLNGKAGTNTEPPNAWIDAIREWQVAQLSADDMAFIATFQPTVEVALPNGKRLLAAHGSPRHFNDEIVPEVPDAEVREMLGPVENTFFCGGHTHLQQIRQLGETFFFNPGSVSLPNRRDSVPDHYRVNRWAEYAILTVEESGKEALEFRRIPYDVDALLVLIDASGMPDAHRLSNFYREVGTSFS